MAKKDIHVVPHNGGWATRTEGAQRVGHIAPTQQKAFEQAREQAKRNHVEVVIHQPDGTIRNSNSNSYGNDPAPPIDKKHQSFALPRKATLGWPFVFGAPFIRGSQHG